MNDFKQKCNKLLIGIKTESWFPFKTGNLKFNATSGHFLKKDLYEIKIDGIISPYAERLEEGRRRRGYKYSNPKKFSLSNKHKGFISEKMINYIIDYIQKGF